MAHMFNNSDIASTSTAVVNEGQQTEQYDGSARRWTFFEIGKTPRGAPRGLSYGVPYMYTKKTTKKVSGNGGME